jgi:uncharacterized protein YndB with AHSA1/START domain
VAEQLGVEPLAWGAQAVTGSYERARRGRAVGEHTEGFSVTASKTVAVAGERLYDAFADESLRDRWLPDSQLHERTATRAKSIRFDWADGQTRVNVTFDDRAEGKSTAVVEHARLPDDAERERMKAYWRERLAALKSQLEEGGTDA